MSKQLPEVRIKYAWLLSDSASVVMNEKWGDGTPLNDFEYYVGIVEKYRQWWAPHEGEILSGMCEILDLEFRQNIIDVNVAPWFTAISDPMVIGPAYKTEDELVNVLTHEILHRLIIDNTTFHYEHDFVKDWKELFGSNHSFGTLVHIPVHAAMKKLYLDIIDRPDLYQADLEMTQKYPDYKMAWNYVNENGYAEILDKLQQKR